MAIASPIEFIRSLCWACGIDPDASLVKSITITARAGDIPRIVVERYATIEELKTVSDSVRVACQELGVKPEIVSLESSIGSSYHVLEKPKAKPTVHVRDSYPT